MVHLKSNKLRTSRHLASVCKNWNKNKNSYLLGLFLRQIIGISCWKKSRCCITFFFFFWIQGNPTSRKVHFVGSGERVKPRLSQTLTRSACPDSNSRPAVQISSPLSSRYASLEDKCCITSTHNMFFFHFISPQHLLLQNIGSFMCMLSCFIQFSLAGHLVMQP